MIESTPEEFNVARRVYRILDSEPPLTIAIHLGAPRLRESDGLYECGIKIEEPERTTIRYLNAVDSFEALKLSLITLGVIVKHMNEQVDGALRWDGPNPCDISLPSYPDYSLLSMMESKDQD